MLCGTHELDDDVRGPHDQEDGELEEEEEHRRHASEELRLVLVIHLEGDELEESHEPSLRFAEVSSLRPLNTQHILLVGNCSRKEKCKGSPAEQRCLYEALMPHGHVRQDCGEYREHEEDRAHAAQAPNAVKPRKSRHDTPIPFVREIVSKQDKHFGNNFCAQNAYLVIKILFKVLIYIILLFE